MTLRKFINSGIDLSWNETIYLSYQKIPYEYMGVNIPFDDIGFPDRVRDLLLIKFEKYLDCNITCITSIHNTVYDGLDICLY